MSSTRLVGAVRDWSLFGHSRRFITVNLPYETFNNVVQVHRYDGTTGKGEQREIQASHARKLEREMRDGTYTPTSAGVQTRPAHRKTIRELGDGLIELTVDSKNKLPLIDYQHRDFAIGSILSSLTARMKVAGEEEKAILERQIEDVYKLPVEVTIYLDGNAQDDFIRLQAGKSVDPSHMLSLKIARQAAMNPDLAKAFDIARELAAKEGSPYKDQIRFDSRGLMPLPISSLCQKGSSDLSTSLVGLARVSGDMPADKIADVVVEVFRHIWTTDNSVCTYGKVLTPISQHGTKGSATTLIGIAICVVFDMLARKNAAGEPAEIRLDDMMEAVKAELDQKIIKSFAGPEKRILMGAFAKKFFKDSPLELHHGVPLELVKTLSASTYSVQSVPKPEKPARQTKPKTTEGPKVNPKKAKVEKVKSKKADEKPKKADSKKTAESTPAKSDEKPATPEQAVEVVNIENPAPVVTETPNEIVTTSSVCAEHPSDEPVVDPWDEVQG